MDGTDHIAEKTRTQRSKKLKSDLMGRLAKIEGQIRGIRRMIEDDV